MCIYSNGPLNTIHLASKSTRASTNLSLRFRRPPRDHSGAEEHERGEDERYAGKFKRSTQRWVLSAKPEIGPDEVGEGLREGPRTDHPPTDTQSRITQDRSGEFSALISCAELTRCTRANTINSTHAARAEELERRHEACPGSL